MLSLWSSKDVTCWLWNRWGADNFRVLFIDLSPETFSSSFLHFDLHVVLSNLVFAEVELARIFDKHACIWDFNDVVEDVRCGLAGWEDSRSCVLYNLVVLDLALWVDENDAVLVLLDLIVFDQKLLLAFDYENTFSALRVENVIVHDTRLAWCLSTKSDVSLDVELYLVWNDLCAGPLYNQNALIVVVTNHVGIWKALDSHLTSDCDLLIVEVDEVIGAMINFSWWPGRLLVHLTRTVLLNGSATTDRACGVIVRSRRPDGFFLGCHECIVWVVFTRRTPCLSRRNELNVVFLCTADVSHSLLSKFDAGFAVLLDDIAAYVRVALLTLYYDAIVSAWIDDVLPDFGRAVLWSVRTSNLDAVSVTPLDFILDQMRIVVIDLYADFIQVERVANDNCLDI